MIPLVSVMKPAQVVLIGDHMQLQAIVKCRAAKRAKLEVSLFERLATQYETIMLKEQYRMVRNTGTMTMFYFDLQVY